MDDTLAPRWLLLIHQIPPKPNYFRIKVWRRLQRLGAVPVKNAIYALPRNEQAMEDFQWVQKEIVRGGGDVSICEAHFLSGISDEDVVRLFREARNVDYAQVAEEARRLLGGIPSAARPADKEKSRIEAGLARLRRRLKDITAIDYFDAPGRMAAEGLLSGIETRLKPASSEAGPAKKRLSPDSVRGSVWVTRKGVGIDRIASAWLISRFIDPEGSFKFVPGRGYRPASGELRFDMFDGEFTHEGDRCTFEVLLGRFGIADPALGRLAEVVHDIDLKDGKFGQPETVGIEGLVEGIAAAHRDDQTRIVRGGAAFDDLYPYFKRKRP